MRKIKNRLNKFLVVVITLLSTGTALAQPVELTLKEALNYALQNNAAVKKARLDIEGGRYKTDEIRAQALPQLNGSAGLTDNLIIQKNAIPNIFQGKPDETILVAFGQKWNANAALQFSQQLFNQSVFTGLRAAKAGEAFYNLNAEISEETLLQNVTSAYYQILITRENLAVIDSNINSLGRVEKTVSTQFKNGLARKIDLDRVRVNLTNLKNQRQQVKNAVTLAENALKYNIGMPIAAAINIPAAALSQIKTDASLLSASLNLNQLKEYQLAKKQEELLGYQKKAYQAEYFPSLSLTSSYLYNGLSNKFDFLKGNSSVQWVDAATVGLSLRIPIFDGNARKSRVKQAEVDIQQAKEDTKNAENALNLSFENAKLQIENSINTINSQQENVNLAEEVLKSTQNNYKNGLATLTDLLDAENSLTEAKNSYNQALLNYRLAEVQLIKSNGNIKSLLN
ncbi:TolC family protein [Desertivirga arenae]|uniref:TolC family protein n=1 Tax=Desertivirga arenae TaxID=2810309 RepID=UPI001A971C8A|nr:TolC family protein [Pedobacter sp. SYSU D00823]